MRARWPRFGRTGAPATPPSSDKAVAAVPAWLLCAVIAASTTALLGTSESSDTATLPGTSPPEPTIFTTYPFARNAIDGGLVELTEAAPTATFYVTITATDLAPNGVQTTNNASAQLHGLVTTSELSKSASPPLVSIQASSPDSAGGSVSQTLDEIAQTQTLQFTGDCAVPKNADCRARFAVAVRRLDDGAAGGKVTVNWSFDVASSGQLPATTASSMGTQDPPWTVQVTAP
jgi:hypothetical protein